MKYRNPKQQKFIRYAFVCAIVLMACILTVSLIRRQRSEILPNIPTEKSKMQNDIIFDDIKIKIHEDPLTFDSISHEAQNNEVVNYLKNNLRCGDTIVHVSHGVGVQALLIAKLIGQSGRVYLFNPSEKYVSAIDESAKVNDFSSRIVLSSLAISNKTFDGLLVYKNNFSVMSGRIKTLDYKVPTGFSAMKIKVSAIDTELPNVQNINLLRINTCDGIGGVIDGAMNMIKKSDNIQILCDFYAENVHADLFAFERLISMGFKMYLLEKNTDLKNISISDIKKLEKAYLLFKRG